MVPDGLWKLVAPLLPSFNSRPQGGGTAPCDERAVFAAVVHVLTSGCAWRHLPETLGLAREGTSPVHRVDPGGAVASAPPGGPGRTWRAG
ncbi:transposase [Streptomyces sp. NPDC003011]